MQYICSINVIKKNCKAFITDCLRSCQSWKSPSGRWDNNCFLKRYTRFDILAEFSNFSSSVSIVGSSERLKFLCRGQRKFAREFHHECDTASIRYFACVCGNISAIVNCELPPAGCWARIRVHLHDRHRRLSVGIKRRSAPREEELTGTAELRPNRRGLFGRLLVKSSRRIGHRSVCQQTDRSILTYSHPSSLSLSLARFVSLSLSLFSLLYSLSFSFYRGKTRRARNAIERHARCHRDASACYARTRRERRE